MSILRAGAKRGPHRHARTARACCRMNVLSGLERIGTLQTLRFARWWKLGQSRHTGVPGTANCFSPGDHSPSVGNDSRHRRLQVGCTTSSRASHTPPHLPRGSLWVLETVAMAEGRQFPFLAAEGAQPPRWEKLGFPVTRVTTNRCSLHTGDTTNALIRKYGKWMRSRMMQNKSNPAKTKH